MDDILDVEVLLSNFENRESVTVREFLGIASMNLSEHNYRLGERQSDVPQQPTGEGNE